MAIHVAAVVTISILYVIIFAVGIFASCKNKKGKNENYSDVLLVARRDFGCVFGALTLTATWIGGGYINGTAEAVYDETLGLLWTFAPFTILVSMCINAQFLAERVREANYVTMLDPIQNKFGRVMGALCFLPALSGEVFYSASILGALGSTLSVIVGIDMNVAIILSAAIAVLYTLIGGLYSVSYTDIVQLFAMFIGLYICLPFAFTHPAVGSISATAYSQGNTSGWLGEWSQEKAGSWFDIAFMAIFGDIPWQTYFQRVLASSSPKNGKMSTYIAVIGFSVLTMPSILIGAIAASTDWNQTTYGFASPAERNETALILPIVLQHLTPTPVALIGLSAISAAVMSSTDSSILSVSSMFSRNVYQSLLRPKASQLELTWVLRLGTLFFGSLACIIAIYSDSIYDLFILCSDFVFVILFPQLISVLFLDVNKYGSYPCFFIGLVLRVGAGEEVFNVKPFIPYPSGSAFPFRIFSMLTSFTAMVTFSYLARYLFQSGILELKYDFLRCNLGNKGRSRLPKN